MGKNFNWLFFLFCLSMTSCGFSIIGGIPNVYLCKEEGGDGTLSFAYNSISVRLGILELHKRLEPFGLNADYTENLTAETKKDAYNFTVTKDQVIVNYVEGYAMEAYKSDEGEYMEYVDIYSETQGSDKWKTRYHTNATRLKTCIFDTNTKQMRETVKYFPILSKKTSVYKFEYHPGTTQFKQAIKQGRFMEPEEIEKAFGGRLGVIREKHYKCDKESVIISFFRFILNILRYV